MCYDMLQTVRFLINLAHITVDSPVYLKWVLFGKNDNQRLSGVDVRPKKRVLNRIVDMRQGELL